MALPARRRGSALVIVALLLAGALSVLGILLMFRVKPGEVRAELRTKVEWVTRDLGNDPEKLDAAFEEILANPLYQKHDAEMFRKISKLPPVVHQQAANEREARREAAPLLVLTKDLASISDAELPALRDEVRAARDHYAEARTGMALATRLKEIEARIAAQPRTAADPLAFVRLQADLQKDIREQRFAMAWRKALDLARGRESDADLQARIRPLIESIEKAAAGHAESTLAKAREHSAAGRKAEALRLLDQALPELTGFPQVGPLEALARELR